MTATELRQHNFNTLRDSLAERRRDVYRAFCDHGPATTAELAARTGIGLLSLRPRACELAQLGLIFESGEKLENGKRATIYACASAAGWTTWRDENFPADGQMQMGLNQTGALTT